MSYAALIPFFVLFVSFAGLRIPLTYASFVALLTGSVLTQTLFQATDAVWQLALTKTLEMMVEIGLILLGAFFFLEAGKKTGVIDSLANLVRAITPNRMIQGVLVTFPLELIVEGSSGFGTPLLVIAPILLALDFDIKLCAVLPFISCIIGIPFGALGTPTRLGFPGFNPTEGTFLALAPFVFIAPLLTVLLIARGTALKEMLFSLALSLIYFFVGREFTHHGPELSALGPAFFTFGAGLLGAQIFFSSKTRKKFDLKGIIVYGILLFCMWGGKQIFMDRLIPGSHIRIFNPGFVFIVFALIILATHQTIPIRPVIQDTLARSKRTLIVFFCMTFLVQQLRANGSLELLTHALPGPLLDHGASIIGWMGSMFVGTSTMSNLLLSKVVDPVKYVALASGSAIGVQLAFQSVVAMKSILHDRLNEKQLFTLIAPLSIGFVLILSLNLWIFGIFRTVCFKLGIY
jgi:lactate permease